MDEKSKSSSNPKAKNMMYTQQLQYLPARTVEALEKLIADKLKPKRYALIVHDKDKNENGEPEAEHVQVMMCFENARFLSSVAKVFGDKPQSIEKWDERADNGFSYLVHATEAARKKPGNHQYSVGEVHANFDFATLMEKMTAKSIEEKSAKGNDVKMLLDLLYVGKITKAELESRLTGSDYARYRRQIDDIWAKHLQNRAEEFRKEMQENGERVRVIWIYGPAGTGKTSFARVLAEKAGSEYYMSGSSRDIFQGYSGEHTIILDELRPYSIPYSDLLRITDPFGMWGTVMAPSRFYDKAIACNLMIITTPYDPYKFFTSSLKKKKKVDGFDQLLRRLSLVLFMNQEKIYAMEHVKMDNSFEPIQGTERDNTYSKKARTESAVKPLELYNSLFN